MFNVQGGNNTSAWVSFFTIYKNVDWDIPSMMGNNTVTTVDVPFGTPIVADLSWGSYNSTGDLYFGMGKYREVTYNSMPTSIDFGVTFPDVSVSSPGWGNFTFGGTDLSQVDVMDYWRETHVNFCGVANGTLPCDFYMELDAAGYGVPSGWNPDWSQILPREVYTYVQ